MSGAGHDRKRQPEKNGRRARTRLRERQRRGGAIRINMAPMIDMTFLLFSFVIVTSTFERPEGVLASQLPERSGAPSVALPFSPIVIRLTQTGAGENDFDVAIDRAGRKIQQLAELPQLLRQLREQPGFDETTPVVIVADDEVRWDHVVSCWNAALRAGCENIAFAQP
jgi:biopolymer transport protein ExbD